jgi:hypothetical protein
MYRSIMYRPKYMVKYTHLEGTFCLHAQCNWKKDLLFSKALVLSSNSALCHISEHNNIHNYPCENIIFRIELLNNSWGHPETDTPY